MTARRIQVRLCHGRLDPEPIRRFLDDLGFECAQVEPLRRPDDRTGDVGVDLIVWDLSEERLAVDLEVKQILDSVRSFDVPGVVFLPPDSMEHRERLERVGLGVIVRAVSASAVIETVHEIGKRHIRLDGPREAAEMATVLGVAGDEAGIKKLHVAASASAGHVCMTRSLDEARATARRVDFDAVVVAASAGDDKFGTFAKEWTADDHTAPLIVVGLGADVDIRGVFRSGVTDCLPDTDDYDALAESIESVLRDRHERRRRRQRARRAFESQRELQRMNDLLRVRNKAIEDDNIRLQRQGAVKSEVLAIAAHELKSPLAAMNGALEILCDGSENFDPGDIGLLDILRRNTTRMIKLVEDILDLSRLDAGKVELRRLPVDLRELFDHALEVVSVRAATKAVKLRVDQPPERKFALDEERMVQMLVNLFDNAVKFSPEGGEVTVQSREQRGQLHIVVSDSGYGIPDSDRRRIFDRFHHKAREGDPTSAGSGLGLTITRALAKLHGGSITVGDSPSGGAQFTISLPIVD